MVITTAWNSLHVIFLNSTLDQLRIQISKAAKREEKLMQELENVKAQVKQLQSGRT
jgi:predicted  nucleic acid-binding Zn-ribbon protein